MFEPNNKCKFCGGDWPHPKGQVSCPAYGKECRKCLRKNYFARCCRNHQDGKGKPIRGTWRACESESDCEVEKDKLH